MGSWYRKCLSEDLEIPNGGLHKPFAFSGLRAWINNKYISDDVSMQTSPRQVPTCSDIKCPKCRRPKLKRVVFSLALFFLLFFIFFLAWFSITSVIHTAAGWTGMLYNLANTTMTLHGTTQRQSDFMSPKICLLLMPFHLPKDKECGLVLLEENVTFPFWIFHRDFTLCFPAHMVGITVNLNSHRLATSGVFQQIFLCPVISLLLWPK